MRGTSIAAIAAAVLLAGGLANHVVASAHAEMAKDDAMAKHDTMSKHGAMKHDSMSKHDGTVRTTCVNRLGSNLEFSMK